MATYRTKDEAEAAGASQAEIDAARRQENLPKQQASLKERTALGETGALARVGTSYFDPRYNIDVFAQSGQYFEELEGGGIKVKTGEVPTGTQVVGKPIGASNPVTETSVGMGSLKVTPIEGKTIVRTGKTIKNPQTGVDEHAADDEMLIEYSDGTVERRKISDVNTPTGQTTTIGEFGRTAEELGIPRKTEIKGGAGAEITRAPMTAAQALAAATTLQAKEEIITGEGLAGTANFEFIGATYKAANGETRVAAEGNAFYQDKTSRKIVERPISQKELAQPTTSPSILAERAAAPTITADQLLANYGVTANPQGFTQQPIQTFESTLKQVFNALGLNQSGTAKQYYEGELKNLDKTYADDRAEIDENPWLAEGLRNRKQDALTQKYNVERAQLVSRVQLIQSFEDSAKEDAKFAVGLALQQYNADRSFEAEQINAAYNRAQQTFANQLSLANLQLNKDQFKQSAEQFAQTLETNQQQFAAGYQLDVARLNKPSDGGSPFAGIKSAQGGLIDLNTGQWLVSPTPNVQSVDGGLYDLNTNQYIVPGDNQKLQQLAQEVSSAGPNAFTKDEIRQKAQSLGLDSASEEVNSIVSSANTSSTIRKLLGF